MAAGFVVAQEHISFPTQDGGVSTPMCTGEASAPLCWHMEGRFDKESWEKQARALAKAGFRVLAIDFCGTVNPRGLKMGQ